MSKEFELTVYRSDFSDAKRRTLPFAMQIPIRFIEYNEETRTVIYEADTPKELANFRDVVHGGMLATIFDNCMGETVRGILKPAWGATVNLNTSYLRPVPLNATLRITVRLLSSGKSLATMDLVACVKGEEDKPTNLATGTFSLKY